MCLQALKYGELEEILTNILLNHGPTSNLGACFFHVGRPCQNGYIYCSDSLCDLTDTSVQGYPRSVLIFEDRSWVFANASCPTWRLWHNL